MRKTIRRRRIEKKTDYKSRLALLKSEKPRLVIRKTNRYIIANLVKTDIAQDNTIININSKSLLEKGWPKEFSGSLKSISAAYLTGLLLGNLAKSKLPEGQEIILDIGMHRNISKSRIYSLLKGALDSGLKISHDPSVLPTEKELTKNEKLSPVLEKIKSSLK